MQTVLYKKIAFDGAYDDGENLYVSCEMFNGFLKVSKKTLKSEYLCRFDKDISNGLALHHAVYRYEDSLIISPDSSIYVYMYDMKTGVLSSYAIDKEGSKKNRCVASALWGNKLWLFFAYAEHPVIIFNLDSRSIEEFYGIIDNLPPDIIVRDEVPVFWTAFSQNEDKAYAAIWNSSYIVEINLKKEQAYIGKMSENAELTTVTYDGSFYWGIDAHRKEVYKCDKYFEIVKKYRVGEEFLKTRTSVGNIMHCEGEIIVLFGDCDKIFRVNERDSLVEPILELPKSFRTINDIRKKWRRFFNYDVVGNVIRVYPVNSNMMLEIDVEAVSVSGYEFILDDKYDDNWYQCNIINPCIEKMFQDNKVFESRGCTLDDYLNYIICK